MARRAAGAVGSVAGRATVQPDAVIAPATALQFKNSGNSAACIELTGDVTQESIERLALILDAQKLVFPTEDEIKRPAVEQAAEQTIEVPLARTRVTDLAPKNRGGWIIHPPFACAKRSGPGLTAVPARKGG